MLSLASANDLADARNEHVHRADGFFVIVAIHVKRLDRSWIVEQDHRLLKMLLRQETLVFALQVRAPFNRIVKFVTAVLQDLDGFSVRQANKLAADD